MHELYYNIPFDFQMAKTKHDLPKIALTNSISAYIFMLITTSFGECKFDTEYGCRLWETDFDFQKSDNELKNFIKKSIFEALERNEKRLFINDIIISLLNENLGNSQDIRIKKKVILRIKGKIIHTNGDFSEEISFFISPLSY